MSPFSVFSRLTSREIGWFTGLQVYKKKSGSRRNKLANHFSRSPKKGSSQKRDVTITLDRTRHQARPCLLVVTGLIIDAGGSATQTTESRHPRDPRIVVGSARVSRLPHVTDHQEPWTRRVDGTFDS